jgi:hypothetical protein
MGHTSVWLRLCLEVMVLQLNHLATLNIVMTYLIFLADGTFLIDTVLSVSVTQAGRD